MLAETIGEFVIAQGWQFALLAGLLAAGAFFSAAETALFSLSRGDLFRMGRSPHRLSRLVPSLMRRPDGVLTTVLLGTNVTHILYFVFCTLLIDRAQRQLVHGAFWAVVLAAGSLLAMILFGEILPKTVAFLFPRRLAPLTAPVLATVGQAVRPMQRALMVAIVEPLTRLLAPRHTRRGELNADEMAALLALSQKRGIIGPSETELLQEVLELTDLRARDVMVPRVDVAACDADAAPEAVLAIVRERRITKVPVYEDDLDHVVGVVHAKRLLADPSRPLREVAAAVQFVPASATLERVLIQFRATRSQLAIVVDEYGGTAGLITLADVLEEIVGDIPDEHEADRGPAVQQVGPAEWLVDADLPIHEWDEALPEDLSEVRFNTVGGLVISLLGRIPRVGEKAAYRNVTFTVEAMRGRRVALLRVRLVNGEPSGEVRP